MGDIIDFRKSKRTDNKAKIHVIDPQDEHHHDEADAHVFMLNDMAMPKAGE